MPSPGVRKRYDTSSLNRPSGFPPQESINDAGGTGMSTPPTSGLNIPTVKPPLPNAAMPQQFAQTFASELQVVESQIQHTHPNTPQDVVRQMATQLVQQRHNHLAQAAKDAAEGEQGRTAIANGPHQYAQLLRAQQQAQLAAAARFRRQANSSGGSATTPAATMQDLGGGSVPILPDESLRHNHDGGSRKDPR
jgi:chromatin modification-related protein VID21